MEPGRIAVADDYNAIDSHDVHGELQHAVSTDDVGVAGGSGHGERGTVVARRLL
jgi:hypothetical protein